MREIADELSRWLTSGEQIALATIVWAEGSSPRAVGSRMAVTASGHMAGSVSGGCVEGAVFEEAQEVLSGGSPKRLRYGVVDESGWEVGLACGGTIEVYVEPLVEVHRRLLAALEAEETVALATRLDGTGHLLHFPRHSTLQNRHSDGAHSDGAPTTLQNRHSDGAHSDGAPTTPEKGHSDGAPTIPEKGHSDGALATELTALFPGPAAELRRGAEGDVFLEVFAPPPTLVIVGAVHIAVPLVTLAQTLGFRVRLVDARRAFATRERFPTADELIVAWPQEALDAEKLGPQHSVVILTHDPKFDVPALQIALRSRAGYIGLIGSRKTQAKRQAALREAGFGAAELARIHGPVGLDLGGREPAEIALAIIAEIVAVRHGRDSIN